MNTTRATPTPDLQLLYSGVRYQPAAGTITLPLTTSGGLPIPYMERSHVHAWKTTDGFLNSTPLLRPSQYDFNTTGESIVLVAPTVTGEEYMLLRNTPLTPYIQFADGAMLTAEQLNRLARVNLYRDQELADTVLTSELAATVYGQWNRMPRWADPDAFTADERANTVTLRDQRTAEGDGWASTGWLSDDKHVATTAALAERFDVIVSDTTPPLPGADYRQAGKLWINSIRQKIYYWLPGQVQAWVEFPLFSFTAPGGSSGGGSAPIAVQAPLRRQLMNNVDTVLVDLNVLLPLGT